MNMRDPMAATGAATQASKLSGRTVLVTGGGRGLGAAICEMLCKEGAHVFVGEFRGELAEQCVSKLRGDGGSAEAAIMDVGDEKAVERAIRAVHDRHGRFDILVNNAAVDITAPIDEIPIEDFDRVLRTNLRGAIVTTKMAVPYMKKQGRGHIVNIASTASKRAWPNASAYHTTKWGLLGFSHAMHAELRPHGIKVSAVLPGGMKTPFLLDRFPDIDPGVLQDPRNVAEAVKYVLLMPDETVIPEVMVIPMRESSWP
ncbi:MAG TPA: SDR family oxidoreductase [Usitatibacter sp.]|nr:SDR family oxidoreductase [Usitatibacter sp.]